jgi:hypothetical protein
MIAGCDGPIIQRGKLVTAKPGESEQLQQLMAKAARVACGEVMEPGGTLSVTRPSGARSLSLLVSPLRKSAKALGADHAVAAVFVSDPEIKVAMRENLLSELYGLTRSESRLAAKIVQATRSRRPLARSTCRSRRVGAT